MKPPTPAQIAHRERLKTFWSSGGLKLKEARKAGKRRYENTSPLRKETARESSRRSQGLPETLPKMKPWDYVKGKVNP